MNIRELHENVIELIDSGELENAKNIINSNFKRKKF